MFFPYYIWSLCWLHIDPWWLRVSLVAQMVKNQPIVQETWVQSLGQEDPLEEEMATHSIIFAWKIPRSQEPGELQSIGSKRVGHDWANNTDRWWRHVDPCTNDAQICPCNLFSEAQISISGKLAHLRDKQRIFFLPVLSRYWNKFRDHSSRF